ncbi:MAG TPA: GGDEF domain-containing protein [Burkholderiales bacterium]
MASNHQQQAPSEIAREALHRLAQRRIAPTPDNYAEVYCEIAGSNDQSGAVVLRLLESFAADLSKREGALQSYGRLLAQALTECNWKDARDQLDALIEVASRGPEWAQLLRTLLKQLETRHAGLTDARKREMLDHVLTAFAGDSTKLHTRLTGLVRSWVDGTPAPHIDLAIGEPQSAAASELLTRSDELRLLALNTPMAGPSGKDLLRKVLWLVADTMERGVMERLSHSPKLAAEAHAIIQAAHWASTAADIERLSQSLKNFWYRFEVSGEGPDRVIEGLGALLRLMVENLGELVGDESWVSGQVEHMREVLAGPINERSLRDAERSFRRVLYRQAAVKISLDEAKQALKSILTTFIDRLGTMAADTGNYQARMAEFAADLARTDDIHQIGAIVEHLTEETRGIHADMQRNYDELQLARHTAAEQEAKVRALEQELESISHLVREDNLTRALNRRGLAEAFVVEAARSERKGTPLCLAILDVDDFKTLNDRYGHATGDQALIHLSSVVRRALRPSDIIARYGGEEFIILLPETNVEDAAAVMQRTQRELTRHFFMHDNERLLITFSVGVAERRAGEVQHNTIDRADAALYLAKRQGKNQVVQAEVPIPL